MTLPVDPTRSLIPRLPAGDGAAELDAEGLRELAVIDGILLAQWNLGESMMLAWSRQADEAEVLAVPHYRILEPHRGAHAGEGTRAYRELIDRILSGPKLVPAEMLRHMRRLLGPHARLIRIPLAPGSTLPSPLISDLVTRYGVTHVRERAVILLDIVGFSLHAPFEQVAMLNSLSYSVNSASRHLLSRSVEIDFARTTTGDGFYIWNRSRGLEADIALYKLLMLVLADNAVARRRAHNFPVPVLRAAFHIGEHYEFYQVEGLNPTAFSYIVGHVTIELARILAGALPGQILLGDFRLCDSDSAQGTEDIGAPEFIERAAARLQRLSGLEVAGDRVAEIRCYLTGQGSPGQGFRIDRYTVPDKHGLSRWVYNAKMNIHLSGGEPIYLGIQNRELQRQLAAKN